MRLKHSEQGGKLGEMRAGGGNEDCAGSCGCSKDPGFSSE